MTSAKGTRQSRRLEEHTYGTSPCRAGRFGPQPPPAHVAGSLAPDIRAVQGRTRVAAGSGTDTRRDDGCEIRTATHLTLTT